MRLENSPLRSPGRVDLFADVVRPFVDWQSSRSRQVLNRLARRYFNLPDGAPPPFRPEPRALPLLDASALLHWVTGQTEIPAPLRFVSELHPLRPFAGSGSEPFALVPVEAGSDDTLYRLRVQAPAEGAPIGTLPVHIAPDAWYASYNQTLQALDFLTRAVFDCGRVAATRRAGANDEALATVDDQAREFVAYVVDLAADFDAGRALPEGLWMTDDILRLLILARAGDHAAEQALEGATSGLRLHRGPGLIQLGDLHPFELSNDLSGWHLVDGVDPVVDRRLWPKPELPQVDAAGRPPELVNCAWRLSRRVDLYPGQALVGEGFSVDGTRSPEVDSQGQRQAKDRRFAQIAMLPLGPDELPARDLPAPPPDADLPFMFGLAPVQPGDAAPVSNVRFSGLHIFVDHPVTADVENPGLSVPRLAGVFDLDGGDGILLERLFLESGRRRVDGDNLWARLAEHVIVIGRTRPTSGTLIKEIWTRCAARGVLRFGPGARRSCVVGAELSGFCYGHDVGALHWDAGSVGNVVTESSFEPEPTATAAVLLMRGRAGAFEFVRFEPEKRRCPPDSPPRLRYATHYALIEPGGLDNVLQSTSQLRSAVRDRGLGTWDRDITDGSRYDGGVFCDQSFDNLLEDVAFQRGGPELADPRPVVWQASVPAATRRLPPDGVRLSAGADLTQTIPVWSAAAPPARPEPFERRQNDLEACLDGLQSPGSLHPPRVEGERTFVAAVVVRAVGAPAVVSLELHARTGTKPRAVASAQSSWTLEPGASQELFARIALPPGATTLACVLAVARGTADFTAPALVEGARMPARPLRALTVAGGAMDGPLVLPGATAVATLDFHRPYLVPEPATARTAHLALPAPWSGGSTCINLVCARGPGTEEIMADLWLFDGSPQATARLRSDAGNLGQGDLLLLRRRDASVRGGMVPSILHALVASVELSLAL